MPPPVPTSLIWDGWSTVRQGMNNGSAQQNLGAFQAALMINATARGEFVTQRPGFKRIMTVLEDPAGMFQHFGDFRTDDGRQFLMAVVAGHVYRIDPFGKTVLDVSIPGDPNPSSLRRGYSEQAECFWLYNDGQTRTFIFNGGSSRRATNKELEPGTVLAYVQGRIWYALPDGLSFKATDLVRNRDSGTAAYNYRDSILRETENDFLNEGGTFSVPARCGEITAMAATSILDTSQGQGPLQVLCQRNGFSVNTPVDREVWKNVRYPIQTESLIGSGCAGDQNTINVNGDLFFRAPDGIRSFIIARRQFRDWGNTPQSFEMSGLLKYDQPDLLQFGSAAVLDNRYITTMSPAFTDEGIYHRGLAVIDLAPITSIQSAAPPVYDGMWTGLNILAIRQTVEGVYMLVRADDGSIELWQMTTDSRYDNVDGRVQWTVVPRALFVERDPVGRPMRNLKRLETADLEYDQIEGLVQFRMFWQPDSYPCPTLWAQWQECVTKCFSNPPCDGMPLVFHTGYQPRKRLPQPPEACATGSKRPLNDFYTLNPTLQITGPARLLSVRIGASPQPEPKYEANTCDTVDCIEIRCCGFDPFAYRSQGSSGGGGSGSGSDGSGGSGSSGGDSEDPPYTEPRGPWNNISEPACGDGYSLETFQPGWTSPEGLGPRRVGVTLDENGNGCEPGVLERWMAETWAKWLAVKAEEGYVTTGDQLVWYDTGVTLQPGFYANSIFVDPPYYHPNAQHWRWEIWVEFCRLV